MGLPFKLRPLFKVNLLILSTPYRINITILNKTYSNSENQREKENLKRSWQEGMSDHLTYRGIQMIIIVDISSETTLQKKGSRVKYTLF